MKIKIKLFIILFCFLLLSISNVFAEVTIRGKVQYWNLEQGINATKDTKPEDIEGGCYLPARRLLLEVEFDSPLTIDEQTYTDDLGYYEVTHRNPLVGDWEVDIEVRAEVNLTTISGEVTDNEVWVACYEGALDIWPYNGQTGDRSVGDDETITFDVYMGGPLNNIEEWDGDEEGEGYNHLIAFFMCQVILDDFNWLKERLPDLEVIQRDTSLFYPVDTEVTHYNQTLNPPGIAWIDVKKGFYYPEVIDRDVISRNNKTISQRWQGLRSSVTHEYGHKIMHDIYWTLPRPLKFWESSDHEVITCKSPEFGWKEGWAEFFSAAVLNWPTINGEKGDLSNLLSYKKAYNIEEVYYPDTEQIIPFGLLPEIVPRIAFDGKGDFNWRDQIPDDKRAFNEAENAAVLWDIFDPKGWEYLPQSEQESKPIEWPVPLKWYDYLEDPNFEHIWEMIAGEREYSIGVTVASGVRQPDCLIDEGDVWEDSFWYYWKNKDDGYGNDTELMHGLKAIMFNRGITSVEYGEHRPEVRITKVDMENNQIEIEVTEEDSEDQPYLYYNLVYPDDTGEYYPVFAEDQPLNGEWQNNTLSLLIDVLPFYQWSQNKLIVKVHDNMLCSFTDYVYVPPPLELKVGWEELPSFIPLNSRKVLENDYYPGHKAIINCWVKNESKKNFLSSSLEYQNIPLKLSLFIDHNDDHHYDDNEKVWEEEIDNLPAISDKSFSIELLLSLDREEEDDIDNTMVYLPGFHECKLAVSVLEEEENKDNNSIIETVEFISSPELVIPDFAIENANFSLDWYKNVEVQFDIVEKCADSEIINKWNLYHPEDPYIPRWGAFFWELSLRDEQGNYNLLGTGETTQFSYHEIKSVFLERINFNYLSAGSYSLYLEINPGRLLSESNWENNHAFLDWFTLTEEKTLPWFTKGGDRGHTGWKNINLKPPLITDWTIETEGIPIDMVGNSRSFFVLSTSGTITKYNSSAEEQFSIDGFEGTPLSSSALLLIYPDTEQERLLAFSNDNRLVMIDTQSGNKIWTSNNTFADTTYGSKRSVREYSRSLDYDGYFLLAAWPIALYHFESNMAQPELLWETDKNNSGEIFLLGNYILAGQYLYSLEGEELEYISWIHDHAIRYLQNIFTEGYKYNYLSGQLSKLEEMWNPGAIFSDKIIAGRPMQCFDYQGNQQWIIPDKIEQEYYPSSSPQSIPVYIEPNSLISLGSDDEAYAYCINHGCQLLAVDLINGQPVWYREFVETPEVIKNIRENLPDYVSSQFHLNSAFHQTPLNMAEGFAVDITCLIPFQNSLLVGTVGQKIYRLFASNLDQLVVQGYIPSVFYGPSTLKVRVQAINKQGMTIPLEDKITVTGDNIDSQHLRYYAIQEEISLPIKLADSERLLVDYPETPSVGSNYFDFVDVQNLFPRFSTPLVINNIQSRPRLSQKNVPEGKIFTLTLNPEAEVIYEPKQGKNTVTLYYSGYGQEEISQVLYEHSYNIGVSIRDTQLIAEDYEFIDLKINLPEEIVNRNFSVKVNGELYPDWTLAENALLIHCLNAFVERDNNHLSIIVLKKGE